MIDFCNYQWTTAMEGGRLIHTGQPWMWYDCDEVLSNGKKAQLYAYKDPTTVTYEGKTYHPTVACGLIRSVDTFGYGHFSAEIVLPQGRNLWPSFWLCGVDEPWPQCGEIDIMEAWTGCFGYFRFGIPQPPYLIPSWKTTNNVHWEYLDKHGYTGSRSVPLFRSLKRPAKRLVKYEVEWRSSIINFYVNGRHTRCYGYEVARHLIDKRMRVILNLWTTGDDFVCKTPMKIMNFEYRPLYTL